MIEKVDNNQIQNILENTNSTQPNPVAKASDADLNDSLQVNYSELIEKAAQQQEIDETAIARAQELIASGQLESAENFNLAAENIINFGI
jgi:hypothetical protein